MIVSNLKTCPINIILINLLLCLAQICHSFDNDFINQHVISVEDEISMEEGSSKIQNKLNNIKLLESYQNENLKIPSSSGMSSSSLEDPIVLKTWGKLQIRPGLVRFSSSKPQSLPDINASKRRNKRKSSLLSFSNFFHGEVVQDVCPSVSDWVAINESIDPYGNPVNVVQRITVNGTVVNQYFYETFCASKEQEQYDEMSYQYGHRYNDEQECKGIDKKAWNSRCRENYIWTYGRVLTSSGHDVWSVIGIRGSCGCAIWKNEGHITGRGRRVVSKGSRYNYKDNHIYDPFY